jgi:hypothetical protein
MPTEKSTTPSTPDEGAVHRSSVDDNTTAGEDIDPKKHRADSEVVSKLLPNTFTAVPPDSGPAEGLTESTVGVSINLNLRLSVSASANTPSDRTVTLTTPAA